MLSINLNHRYLAKSGIPKGISTNLCYTCRNIDFLQLPTGIKRIVSDGGNSVAKSYLIKLFEIEECASIIVVVLNSDP